MGHLEGIAVFQLRSTMLSVTPWHELVEARDLIERINSALDEIE